MTQQLVHQLTLLLRTVYNPDPPQNRPQTDQAHRKAPGVAESHHITRTYNYSKSLRSLRNPEVEDGGHWL